MRRITLELLRHGQPHNQLLSPLTEYIALCENHGAVTFHVPFEHNQMLYRLRALSYRLGPEPREFQVVDTANVIGKLLGEIPGLTADLNRPGTGAGVEDTRAADQVTHLRLVVTASELALLPFELATSPNGFPGAGQPLALQTRLPVCITRETRRFPSQFIRWPAKPRILFAFASPTGFEAVPAQAHLLALREALTPWLALMDDFDDDRRLKVIGEQLCVLPDATAESLEAACAANDYTHIHLLAHGVEITSPYDQRFGLALHSDRDPSGYEAVSGERLATILRTPRENRAGQFTRPAVVTLASCNGGNVGTVSGVGASIGHALHEAGIPFVVASQYPLSFGGSVMLVKDLYDGLLWGEDPRKLLVGLRRRLHSFFKDTHDWASIVAYASLPPDFDDELANACLQQSMRSIKTATCMSDRVMMAFSTPSNHSQASTSQEPVDDAQRTTLEKALAQVAAAKRRLTGAMESYPALRAKIFAQLGSTEKREAQMLYYLAGGGELDARKPEGMQVLRKLESARDNYWNAYLMKRSVPWELVQFLSLTLLLQCLGQLPKPLGRPEQDVAALWLAACVQSLNDAEYGSRDDRAWACANLAELYLIAPFVEGLPQSHIVESRSETPVRFVRKIVSLTGIASFHVFSTRRQLLRYVEWFMPMTQCAFAANDTLLDTMLDELPACDEPEWDY